MFAALFQENEDGEDNSQDASVFTSPSSHLNSPPPGRNASGFVGLENQGATCYMNSLLQAWFMTPEIRGALYSLSPETELNVANIKATDVEARKLKSKAPRKVPLHLQKLFTELQYSQRRSVTTSELTKEGFGWKDGDARIQHDLDALYNELVDAVSRSLVKTSGENLQHRLLEVRTSNSIVTITDPPYISTRNDQGFSLQIPSIKGVPDLTTALDNYFTTEHLDDGNPVYKPDSGPFAGTTVPADRVTKLDSLSPILMISVNRTHFDMEKFQAVKLKDRFDCPLVLDMRPYFADSTVSTEAEGKNQERKQQAWGKKSDTSSTSGKTACSVNVWPAALGSEEGEAEAMSASASVPNEEFVYDLFAVVLHHGNSANSGHYTSYICDTLNEGNWTPPEYKPKKQASGKKTNQMSSFGTNQQEKRYSPESPLRVIATILLNCKRDTHTKLYSCDVGQLGAFVKKSTGEKYAKKYPKKLWPSLKNFCSENSDFFRVSGGAVMLNKGKEKCIAEIDREWKRIQITRKVQAAQEAAREAQGSGDTSVGGGDGGGDGGGEDVLTDEQKSMALIAKMQADDDKLTATTTTTATTQSGKQPSGEAWQEVTSKRVTRHTRAANTPDNTKSNSQSSKKKTEPSPADVAESDARDQAAAAKYYAREKRLADNWGRWFWFNDHKVEPIRISDVANAAVGKDSSRMLIYRSRRLNSVKKSTSATSSKEKHSEIGTHTEPPSFWHTKVIADNEKLAAERENYEKSVNTIEISVHMPEMYTVHKSGFCLERGSDVVIQTEKMFSMNLDVRSTIGNFKAQVTEELSKRSQNDASSSFDPSQPFVLNEVLPAGPSGCLHLFRTVGGSSSHLSSDAEEKTSESKSVSEAAITSTSTTRSAVPMSWATRASGIQISPDELDKKLLSDATYGIATGATLLAWDGKMLHAKNYVAGAEQAPIHIQLVKLKKKKNGSRHSFVVAGEFDTYVPANYTYAETLSIVSEACGIPPNQIGVHRIESASSKTNNSKNSNFSRIDAGSCALKSLAALKIFSGCTLTVEVESSAEISQKKGYQPLASMYAHSKTHEMTFKLVDMISPTLLPSSSAQSSSELVDGGGEENATTMTVTVNMNESVMRVKEIFASKLPEETRNHLHSLYNAKKKELDMQGSNEAVDDEPPSGTSSTTETTETETAVVRPTDFTCRIRGHNAFEEGVPFGDAVPIGPGVLLGDETKLMKEFRGLSKDDILYLELGRPLLPDHISIRFFVVHDNLQTQAGGQGKREPVGRWLHIHKKATTSQALKAICDQIGVPTKNHRLRQVAGSDSGKLCTELDRSIVEYANHGETLLIEDGTVPRKGVVTLNMHLFVTSEERIKLEKWELEQAGVVVGDSLQLPPPCNDAESKVAAEKTSSDEKSDQQVKETTEEDAFFRSRRLKRECVHALKPFDVAKSKTTMLELKASIAQHPTVLKLAQIRHVELSEPTQLRVRELDKVCFFLLFFTLSCTFFSLNVSLFFCFCFCFCFCFSSCFFHVRKQRTALCSWQSLPRTQQTSFKI